MSLLPNDLAPGSTAVIPMLTEAGPTQAFFAPASGGGGGGGGPNPVVSTITIGGQYPTVNMASGGVVFTANGFDTTSTIAGILYTNTPPENGVIGGNDFTEIQVGTLETQPVMTLGFGGDGRSCVIIPSTLSIYGDSVLISSIYVSSINGAQPGGAVPEDLTLNSLSTVNLNVSVKANFDSVNASTIFIKSAWPVPVQQFGSLSLDNGGSTIVGVDYQYTDPWYQFANYKGIPPVSAPAPLFTSTVGPDSFIVYGTPNLSIVWNTLGN